MDEIAGRVVNPAGGLLEGKALLEAPTTASVRDSKQIEGMDSSFPGPASLRVRDRLMANQNGNEDTIIPKECFGPRYIALCGASLMAGFRTAEQLAKGGATTLDLSAAISRGLFLGGNRSVRKRFVVQMTVVVVHVK